MKKFNLTVLTSIFLCMIWGSSPEHVGAQSGYANISTYLAEFTEALEKQWPENRTINIVCHGHSVPAGYHRTPDVRPFDSYPHMLHMALKKRYPHAVLNVIVTAIGGENSIAGAERFEADVLSMSPDLILIDYGLNDRRAGIEPAAKAWRQMIRQSQEAKIPVILLTPTADQNAEMLSTQDALSRHAAQIRMLAKERRIGLADSYAAVVDYLKSGKDIGQIMSQSNHPNRAGHEMVVQELMAWFPK